MHSSMDVSGDDLDFERRQHGSVRDGGEWWSGCIGVHGLGRRRSSWLRLCTAFLLKGRGWRLGHSAWRRSRDSSVSRGLRLVLCLFSVGEPEIAIPEQHNSQRNQQQNQGDDHHAPLFALLGFRSRRLKSKKRNGFCTHVFECEHAGRLGRLWDNSWDSMPENPPKASKSDRMLNLVRTRLFAADCPMPSGGGHVSRL